MTSIDQNPQASPAFQYHNRFANPQSGAESKSADLPPSTSADDFGFSFEDIKPLDFKTEQYAAKEAAAANTAPPSSEDVAALEAAVARDENERLENDPNTATKESTGPPPLPFTLRQDNNAASSDSQPPSDSSIDQARYSSPSNPPAGHSSWYTATPGARSSVDPPPTTADSAASRPSQSNSQASIPSEPSQQGPTSAMASKLGSLDLNGTPSTDAPSRTSISSSDAYVPQYRTVQSQHPAIVSGATHHFPQVESAQPESFRSVSGQSVPPAADQRERPNSFFGMDRPLAAVNATGQAVPVNSGDYQSNKGSGSIPGEDSGSGFFPSARDGAESTNAAATRPSSFFGANPDQLPGTTQSKQGPSQAERIAAYHRAEAQRQGSSPSVNNAGQTRSTLAGGTGNAYIQQTSAQASGRPASIAPSMSGPLLDHSHLKPGQQAALLSHNKTLELYRLNAKKTNDPDLIYELAVFMVDASKSMGETPSGAPQDGSSKEEIVKEAIGLLKKIAERGHPDAQYFLADCYANGIGSPKGKQDFDRAYPLFVLAAKHGHPDAAYRAGTCCEKGWGCRRDSSKALQFYRKASSQSHPGSMYRLATAELNGELGLKRSAKEGVKWLKRSAENATPEFPHALHELALLHERGIDNVLFVDPEYACELLAQAGEMGYAPSAYKLGVNYEYGRMGCPQDAGLSIHMYNIAAQQNHKDACFSLTAWYLVGAPGILPQSDTEAYLWAKKAAEQNLAKAEYTVGYFTEMGVGTVKDLKEAKAWYTRAAEHGDKRGNQRLAALGARTVPQLTGVGAGANAKDSKGQPKAGQHGESALGTDYASMPQARRTQPTNAPFPSRVEVSSMSPAASAGATTYPSPLTMRDVQSAQREERYLANVAAHQQAQLRAASVNTASQPVSPISPITSPPASHSFSAIHNFNKGGPPQAQGPGPAAGQGSFRPPPPGQQPQPQGFAPPVRPDSAQRGSPGPRQPSWTPPSQPNGQQAPFSSTANYPSYPASAGGSPPSAPGPFVSMPGPHPGMNGFPSQNGLSQGAPFMTSPMGSPPGPGGEMTAMPLRLQSDAAAAQRLAQQEQSPKSPDQPKKKKGWFK